VRIDCAAIHVLVGFSGHAIRKCISCRWGFAQVCVQGTAHPRRVQIPRLCVSRTDHILVEFVHKTSHVVGVINIIATVADKAANA
jgi:hypothetical protein